MVLWKILYISPEELWDYVVNAVFNSKLLAYPQSRTQNGIIVERKQGGPTAVVTPASTSEKDGQAGPQVFVFVRVCLYINSLGITVTTA